MGTEQVREPYPIYDPRKPKSQALRSETTSVEEAARRRLLADLDLENLLSENVIQNFRQLPGE
jgi:hypothetical protein